MDAVTKQVFIRRKAREDLTDPVGANILWTRHGLAALVDEGWTREQIERGLVTAEVIEDYPALHRPLPDCLVLGWLGPHHPFHAVLAVDEERDVLVVITVYQPSLEEWENDRKTRRR